MAGKLAAFALALGTLASCGGGGEEARVVTAGQREDTPTAAGVPELVRGLTAFTFDLYRTLPKDEPNVIVGPSSIGIALAMAYAGARGDSAAQMRDALHFTLPDERLHPAFNALDLALDSRGKDAKGKDDQPFRLKSANAVWVQDGFDVHGEYLGVLGEHYGAGVRLADFRTAAEDARATINEWVAGETERKITELFPEGSLDELTRVVLTNAVYFNAAWAAPFEKGATSDGDFTPADGPAKKVPTMRRTGSYQYARGDGWQAVELPYDGGEVAMLVVVPDAGRLADVERSVDLQAVAGALASRGVRLAFPKFSYRTALDLPDALKALGIVDVFDPGLADLSGIADVDDLHVSRVVHQATIDLDEEGTEAAAATGVSMGVTSAPVGDVELTVDRPFLFAIRDKPTGAVLFLGRVDDPGA